MHVQKPLSSKGPYDEVVLQDEPSAGTEINEADLVPVHISSMYTKVDKYRKKSRDDIVPPLPPKINKSAGMLTDSYTNVVCELSLCRLHHSFNT